jgi:hypothetical protein
MFKPLRTTAAAAALAFAGALALTACEEEGPAEELGESIDESAEEVGEAIEEAGEEVQDAGQ